MESPPVGSAHWPFPDLREDAVAVFNLSLPPPADLDPSRDHQNLLAETPRLPQHFRAFLQASTQFPRLN